MNINFLFMKVGKGTIKKRRERRLAVPSPTQPRKAIKANRPPFNDRSKELTLFLPLAALLFFHHTL